MSLKKKLKKVGKAAAVAGAAYLASKAMAGKGSDKFLSSGAAGGARLPKGDRMARARKLMTSNMAMKGVRAPMKKPNTSIMSKIGAAATKVLNMGPGKNATSKMGGTLAGDYSGIGLGSMDGAKYGGMMKAKTGTYVKASCKLGKNKKTLIT
jgi:hypothetical protein